MPVIDVDGVPLAHDDSGAGPVVVLLHAGIADRRMWRHQVTPLRDRYRVLNVDLPGYGDSGLPRDGYANHEAVAGLLDALDVGQATLVGCSFGGAVALDTALAYPDRVEALALFAPAVSGHPWSEEFRELVESAAIPRARHLPDMPGAAHLLPLERPDLVNPMLHAFLA